MVRISNSSYQRNALFVPERTRTPYFAIHLPNEYLSLTNDILFN